MFVAEIDLAFPRWMVAVEYDGRVHAEDERQFARDADRWTAIRAAGWDHVRVLNHHRREGGASAVALAREALIRAGWRPGL
jgi:very-short-patch-repair endonuclease